jgi:DNA polymerase-4
VDTPARQILHIDMDAFFASVEQRDDPQLRGRPVLVGGPSRRGVVAAASYEARTFGVHSAMPMVEALRRCPQAVVVPGRHERYSEVSRDVFSIFERYTPLVEGLSVDEAFLDVTASRALFGDGEAIARRIKSEVRDETGLVASAGVAPCKFAAKVASDLDKPDGLVVVPADGVAEFLAPLPVERMWGVGPKASERLRAAGISRIGDIARASEGTLGRLLGPSWGSHVRELACGLDVREVDPERDAVSVGAEETFEEDLRSAADLERHLLSQAGRVAGRLHRAGLFGRVVMVKVKYSDFTLKTKRVTLAEPVADTDSIYRAARALLAQFDLHRPVRLTGVAVSGLSEARPPTLFPDRRALRGDALERVAAELRGRFGADTLTRADLLDEDTAARASTRRMPDREGKER